MIDYDAPYMSLLWDRNANMTENDDFTTNKTKYFPAAVRVTSAIRQSVIERWNGSSSTVATGTTSFFRTRATNRLDSPSLFVVRNTR